MCKECGCSLGGSVSYDGVPEAKLHGAYPSPENAHDSHDHGMHEDHDDHHVHGHEHAHDHDHDHDHDHAGGHGHSGHTHEHQVVTLQKSILEKNDRLAEQNRGYFRAKKLLVLNVLSAPGSGKTTFIQKTLAALSRQLRVGVIVGDLATDNDAVALRSAGVPVVQITTGTVCHLEAEMVARAMGKLDLDSLDVLIIENVGNLVCPASFDLGEQFRVVLLSVTEGEDKPLKYPPMFHSANVAVLTKVDLAEAAGFDREKALANLHRVSHHAKVFEVSARTGQGMDEWCAFLIHQREHAR